VQPNHRRGSPPSLSFPSATAESVVVRENHNAVSTISLPFHLQQLDLREWATSPTRSPSLFPSPSATAGSAWMRGNHRRRSLASHVPYKLQQLNCGVQGNHRRGLHHLSSLTNLQQLNLVGCDKVTDAGFTISLPYPPATAESVGCKEITDAGLLHLSALTHLQQLDLTFCDKITDAGLGRLNLRVHVAKVSIWSGKKSTLRSQKVYGAPGCSTVQL